ncbi:Zn-ribbon domain-containing OB-fold protein [Cupriavidus numazuensis]|uniref:Zn-ribbon domain-containing OB-fold protein n=1 Tax=Cupriavidus numazuensis TaxID=221992 RepID=A0ABM8TVN4_9BURK|nr:OB-fold domain-containing protein [Cupriavidus numazuensis]CAG2160737.1 hypothetical protein LMG26411_07711 [Cupriavidus numazuensis]
MNVIHAASKGSPSKAYSGETAPGLSLTKMSEEAISQEFLPHLEGLARGDIQLPYCIDCQKFHWYPMPRCPHCQNREIHWKTVSGDAKLFSWTVVRHAFHPSLKDELPYIVALVTFEDAPGVRLVTNLVGVAPEDIRMGMSLRPVFDNSSQERPKVKFSPV